MTGELTLLGKVLPIGGLKEKSLAAMRQGIKDIIIPFKNVKVEEIPEEFRKKLNFIPVKSLNEVLAVALERKIARSRAAKRLPLRSQPQSQRTHGRRRGVTSIPFKCRGFENR